MHEAVGVADGKKAQIQIAVNPLTRTVLLAWLLFQKQFDERKGCAKAATIYAAER
jgi:hypothetical protein